MGFFESFFEPSFQRIIAVRDPSQVAFGSSKKEASSVFLIPSPLSVLGEVLSCCAQ
jgi:hypothetical protein